MVKVCPVCGKDFKAYCSNQKFCSRDCAKQNQKIRFRQYWEANREKILKKQRDRYNQKRIEKKKMECMKKHDYCYNCEYPEDSCRYEKIVSE